MQLIRKHLGTIAVAGVTAFVMAAGPAVATTVADLAKNSLKLGGKPASAYLLAKSAAKKYEPLVVAPGKTVRGTIGMQTEVDGAGVEVRPERLWSSLLAQRDAR